MKIFSAIFMATIVAITIKMCRVGFLLVQVDDAAGADPGSNNTAKAQEIEEFARQGICNMKPCCCDSCYPCDYEKIFGTKELAEAKLNEKPQDPRGPSSCGIRGCGPPPCPTPCSSAAREDDTKPTKLSEFGKQCVPGNITICPADTCNFGGCSKGCAVGTCTRKRCDVHTKGENQLCYIDRNNCDKGLKCMKQDDGCNNGIGRCVKFSEL